MSVSAYQTIVARSKAELDAAVAVAITGGKQPFGELKVAFGDNGVPVSFVQAMYDGSLDVSPVATTTIEEDVTALQGDVTTLQSDMTAVQTDAAAALLRARWLVANAAVTVHLEADDEGLVALAALTGAETQNQANTRAEALRTAMLAHMAGVGTRFIDGEHKAADTGNAATLAAVPAATALPSCIVLVNALHAADNAHGGQAGVHFLNDSAESAATITVDPPVTLANCITDLNDLRQSFINHFNKGSL